MQSCTIIQEYCLSHIKSNLFEEEKYLIRLTHCELKTGGKKYDTLFALLDLTIIALSIWKRKMLFSSEAVKIYVML